MVMGENQFGQGFVKPEPERWISRRRERGGGVCRGSPHPSIYRWYGSPHGCPHLFHFLEWSLRSWSLLMDGPSTKKPEGFSIK
jgi:hypothetical protein